VSYAARVSAEPGLRARKKQRTRELLAETAGRLFAERGFDSVTVAEVARAADVSEATVFNYFPTKEDLFYSQMESFEEALVEAVRDRPPGESVLAAFRRFILERSARLSTDEAADVVARAARLIGASEALQTRERAVVARYTEALAALIAEETGAARDDVEPLVVAGALMGAQRALVTYVRTSVLEGRRGAVLARGVRAQAKRAFERLERGLADYAASTADPGR
jgi:AcrR family transcriptional regulator